MVSKTTVACCLVLALFVFLETAESQKTCDALVDVTYLIDTSSSWYWKDFSYEKEFLLSQIRALLPSQNEVRIRVMFYSSEIEAKESSFVGNFAFNFGYPGYGSYEDKAWLENIAQTARQGSTAGDNVIQGLLEASIHGPETACRKEHGARRVVVVVADFVDYTWLDVSSFRSTLNERGVEVLALLFGQTFLLERYLNLDGSDRIIRLGDVSGLIDENIHTMVVDELCKETQEMRLYREKMSASFQKKYTYNKHTYYLSKEYFDNLTQVHDTCKSADGYLAVINNQQEYDAMKQYFTDNNPGRGFIIDGTDAVTEGKWTLLSGAPLPFVDWLPNNPGQESDDCLAVSGVTSNFKMFDTFCDGLPGTFPYFFLCEVSEESDDIFDGFTCRF